MKIHRPHIENHNNSQAKKARKIKDDFRYVPQEYKKVAQGLEQQFAQYMLKQMKSTIGNSGEDNSAMNYYKDLNQTEQAKMLSEVNSGLGIQKLILDEIYPEKFRNPEALAAFAAHKDKGLIKKNNIEMEGPPSPTKIEKHESVSIGREANNE